MQGCLEDAGSCLEQSLALARATGDHASEAYASYGLGEVRRQQGRLEEAAGYLGRVSKARVSREMLRSWDEAT
jgi:hypothetical protein